MREKRNIQKTIRFFIFASWSVCTFGILSAFSQGQEGLDSRKELGQFTRQSWQKKHGLPQNSVHAITQTRDGYLWLGTEEGLVRFDGLHFRIFNPRNTPTLENKFVTSLLECSDGSLWIGTEGGGITIHKGDTWTHVPLSGDDIVNTIHEDSGGTIWVGSRDALNRFNGSSLVAVSFPHGSSPWGVNAIAEDANKNLLIGTSTGLYAISKTEMRQVDLGQPTASGITAMTRANDGSLWVGTNGDGVFHVKGTFISHFSLREGLASNVVTALFTDRSASVWIGTAGSGFCRLFENGISSFNKKDALAHEYVHSIFEDSEGNLWIGTSGNGMHRLSSTAFSSYETGSTAIQNMVRAVYADANGTVWAGNTAGEILKWNHNKFERFLRFPDHRGHEIRAFSIDKSGTMWIGLTTGLYTYKKGKLEHAFEDIKRVSALYVDSKGVVWVGSTTGLIQITPKGMSRLTAADGLTGNDVRFMKEGRDGSLWISTTLGLNCYKGGAITKITTLNGLKANHLTSIHIDDEGDLWLGSIGGGLARIRDNQVSHFAMDDGLFDDIVYEILEDDQHNFWMSCNNGVFKVAKAVLNAFADGKLARITCESFAESDGMKSSECNGATQPAACRTSDGRMWFATTAGIAIVDPNNLRINTAPPPVAIEKFLANGKELSLQHELAVAPGRRDIQLDFAAMNFAGPERIRFKYKLMGHDDDWVDAGSRRSAFYNNLGPGGYRFLVTASNYEGNWNKQEASVAFRLEPYFYETPWFIALCALILFGAVGRGFQLYKRYQHRKLVASELETQLTKSQLHALRLQLQPHFLFNTLNAISGTIFVDREKSIKMIAKLSQLLRHNLDQETSQTVPLKTELRLLNLYLDIEKARFGKRLSIRVDVAQDTLEAFVPSFILQPLVENAVHHGISMNVGAGTIKIHSQRVGEKLELTVTDNGSNTERAKLPPIKDGIGLSNTRSRLGHLYGSAFEFDLSTNDTCGMTSRILIPYMNGSRQS